MSASRDPAAPGAVVHVVVAGEIGGAERMLVDLARGPSDRPHSVALITPSDRLRALFRDHGLAVDDFGPAREGPLRTTAQALGRRHVAWLAGVLADRRAAIAHLHTFGSQVPGTRAALRAGARVLRTEHSTRVYDDPSCWPFSRWSLRRADLAVCISEHVRDVALARAPWAKDKLVVAPNGVDVARFSPAPLRDRLEGDERARFVVVGRLEPRKGVDVAIEALALVEGAELTIVGDGASRASLERLARARGVGDRVRFAGFTRDVRPLLAEADAVVSSARAEGLGVALLEAMAMQRPVVALPTGGVPEIVKDGDTGWLAHGSGAHALARAMRDARERPDERRRRGERARAAVVERFSVEAMRRSYERRYASLSPLA